MDHEPPSDKTPAPVESGGTIREFESAELLRGSREILIRHAGETYRLRVTRNDKLILQK